MKIYIAGPMTGIPLHNFPTFDAKARQLRGVGYEVVSPAELTREMWFSVYGEEFDESRTDDPRLAEMYDVFLAKDFEEIKTCDAMVFLPGACNSKGAKLEYAEAKRLKLKLYDEWNVKPHCDSDPVIQGMNTFQTMKQNFLNTQPGKLSGSLIGQSQLNTMPTTLPINSAERKRIPLTTGVLDYFPAALAEVAKVSKAGNDKHNPGEPLHWARGKSEDHADTIMRHLTERGTIDPDDGQRHSAKLAWRALALLQEELEAAGLAPLPRGARDSKDE